jgi:hypothetical protein
MGDLTQRTRILAAVIVVIGSALVSAAPATAASGVCGNPSLSQPFLPWGDPGSYALVPNGGFENGSAHWDVGGGARVVDGNEPFFIHDSADSESLSLGKSGTATSAPVCVAWNDPTLRFMVTNTGNLGSSMQVSVTYPTAAGGSATVSLPLIAAPADWQPSLPLPLVSDGMEPPLLTDGQVPVTLTFTAAGAGGDWSVDDVYVDPFKTK